MPESAMECPDCGQAAARSIAAPAAVSAAPVAASAAAVSATVQAQPAPAAPVAAPAASAARKGFDRRVLIAVVIVAMGGGTLAIALQMNSAAPKPAVADIPAAVPASRTAPAAAASVVTPAAVNAPSWVPANREWLWNPKKGAAFQVASMNKVAVWQGQTLPMLVVRCEAGKMQTFVYTASALQIEAQDENHTVHLTFDDQPEATERWADSSDHDALFAPNGAAFAHRLTGTNVLKVGYSPHNAPRAVAEFHVGGLAALLEPAARQCGWKK
jgi:hypothetical protein